MKISVSALGSLKKHLPQGEVQLEVDQGVAVRQLKSYLGLPEGYAIGYVVNNKAVSEEYILQPSDQVILVMQVGGG